MAMVAGQRTSPRAVAPERDDERCRVSGTRRISDDSSAEKGNAAGHGYVGEGRILTGAPRAARNICKGVDSVWSQPGVVPGLARTMSIGFVARM